MYVTKRLDMVGSESVCCMNTMESTEGCNRQHFQLDKWSLTASCIVAARDIEQDRRAGTWETPSMQ